jgi:hypothetical protein
MMLPQTTRRVPEHTAAHINEAIRRETARRLRYFAEHPALIGRRLAELDEEWDIERVLEANAASVSLVGLALATGVDRRWVLLPSASPLSCFNMRCRVGARPCRCSGGLDTAPPAKSSPNAMR